MTKLNFKALNPDQKQAFLALRNDKLKVVVLTGPAGSGKNFVALAAYLVDIDKFKNGAVISRLNTDVGKSLGTLPGSSSEKIDPYLLGFDHNLATITNRPILKARQHYKINSIPIQLLRGASLVDSFIIIDEAQHLNDKELLTIGTRVGERSKLVILADPQQVDGGRSNRDLISLLGHEKFREAPIAKHVHMSKTVRGEVTQLFLDIYHPEDEE